MKGLTQRHGLMSVVMQLCSWAGQPLWSMAGSPLVGEAPVEGQRPGRLCAREEDVEEDLLGTRSHSYTGGSEQGFALAQPPLSCPRSNCSQQTFQETRSLRERLSGSLASQGAPCASSWARPGRCSPLCHWVPAPTPSLQRLCLSGFPNLTLQCGNRASGRPTVR